MTSTNKISSLASDDDREAVCYLCLDGGVDDNTGQPLRRDCACRGTDAGFVHLECLTNYAETKSKGWDGDDITDEFIKPWYTCPSCHQEYQNELRIDVANKFVPFIRRQYPNDTRMQVEALCVKLHALASINSVKPVQKREVGVTADVLISLIDRMKNESPLKRRYSRFLAIAYCTLGGIALDEGTEESARRAVVLFGKDLKVCEAVDDFEGVATAKGNIAIAKSKYEGGSNEEILKASKELYELQVSKHGYKHENTISSGRTYAYKLQDANRGDEARELLTKLLALSKQVLGSHHNITREIEYHRAIDIMTSINKMNAFSSLASSHDGKAVCYLCLEGGVNELDRPLRRDCACHGSDAGFVHLSCLTKYAAASKNKGTCTISEIIKPWEVCPNCLQEYQNELAVDIATKCVSYVRGTYPRDTRMLVDALFLKLRALKSMLVRLTPVQMKEFDVIANVMLSLIDRLKGEATPLSKYYSEAEAYVYNTLGQIALQEGTEESVKRAVGYFEKKLKVSESIGHAENILIAKRNIALAKSKFKGATIAEFEGIVNATRELYEACIAQLGESSEYTIRMGMNYAIELQNSNRGDEARELLTKSLATSKQVFGPDHKTTKDVEYALKHGKLLQPNFG